MRSCRRFAVQRSRNTNWLGPRSVRTRRAACPRRSTSAGRQRTLLQYSSGCRCAQPARRGPGPRSLKIFEPRRLATRSMLLAPGTLVFDVWHWIPRVVDGAGRPSKVRDLVNFYEGRLRRVVARELEPGVAKQAGTVALPAGDPLEHLRSAPWAPVARVRAKKAGAPVTRAVLKSNELALSRSPMALNVSSKWDWGTLAATPSADTPDKLSSGCAGPA